MCSLAVKTDQLSWRIGCPDLCFTAEVQPELWFVLVLSLSQMLIPASGFGAELVHIDKREAWLSYLGDPTT